MLELLVEQPEAFLGHFVRFDVVDADLKKVQTRLVQLLDPFWDEKIPVRDQAGHHPTAADMADQVVQVWMQHRLAAAEGDNRRPEVR